jgi:hypothetical protein
VRGEPSGSALDVSVVAQVGLGPGERRLLDVPLAGTGYAGLRVEVSARAGGVMLGTAQHALRGGRDVMVAHRLVGLLCVEDAVCRDAQSRVSFAGSDEDRVAKRRALRFVVVREPPAVWWGWAPAWTVLVARPAAGLGAEARAALETWARHGGRVVLVEDRVADAGFLAPYREGEHGRAQPIGAGRIARTPSLADAALDALFTAPVVMAEEEVGDHSAGVVDRSELGWAVRRLARAPTFPSLGALGGALLAYIVVVGVVNFAVLRRLGRAEWAWVSVPALAVLFGAAFYAGAARHRPATFHVDEVALRWLDDRSDVAAVQETVRLSSAGRAAVRLAMAGDAVLTGPRLLVPEIQVAALGVPAPGPAWSARLGPPLGLDVALAPWSFRDVALRGTRRLAGRVRLDGSVLRNETGEAFAQALFVEPGGVYTLGALPVGAAVDLAGAAREPLAAHAGAGWPYPHTLSGGGAPTRGRASAPPAGPFTLVELVRGWPDDGGRAFAARRGLFLGLGTTGALGAQVAGTATARAAHVVTIVSVARP